MIVAQDDGMRIPLCMMDTNTKTSLFVRFVEHIDILNPEETLLFNDYTKLFGSLFTGFSNKQRARSMTQAQEVALFFLMRDEHVGVVGLRILKQREAEITRGLSENQVKEADLKRELRKTTEAIAKHTGGAGLRTLKQQKAEITRSLSETQKKEAELEVELKKTNEAIAKLQPTPSASTAAPQRKRRSSAGKKKPVKGNLSGTSESENESSGCEKDVEYESDRPTPDQNAADESDPDDLGDRLDVEFKPKKLVSTLFHQSLSS